MKRNANRNLLIVALLASTALAGCAEVEPEDPINTNSKPAEGLGTTLDGKVIEGEQNASLNKDQPFVLTAKTGPTSPVTSFLWRIPEGAIQIWRPIPEVPDFEIEFLPLEMFPIMPDGTEVTEWGFTLFALEGNEASIIGGNFGVKMSSVTRGPGSVEAQPSEMTAELEPDVLGIYAGSLEAGDTLAFVFAAKSEVESQINILLSPTDDTPDQYRPPKSAEALLNNRTAIQLPVQGEGEGFQVALYVMMNLFFGTSAFGFEFFTDAVNIEERLDRTLEPMVSTRDVTVSASFDQPGYSEGFADYWGSATAAAGKFDISLDLHGTQVGSKNLILATPCMLLCPPTGLITGYPLAYAIGDGGGSADSSIEIQVASANEFELLFFGQIDIGATVEELTGRSAITGGSAQTGLAGDLPPSYMWADGDNLMVFHHGQLLELKGMAEIHETAAEYVN